MSSETKTFTYKQTPLPDKMGGPRGVLVFAAFFTIYTYMITLKCQTGLWDIFILTPLPLPVGSLFDTSVTLYVLLWFVVQCVLYLLPYGGRLEAGVKLHVGIQLLYRTNALFVLSLNIVGLLAAYVLGYNVTAINTYLLEMFTLSVVLSFMFSICLYAKAHWTKSENRNPCGNTGYVVYDWFIGRELNPRWGALDLKYVLFRSAIIGWILLNICNLLENYEQDNGLNFNLVVLNVLQLWYVVDYFYIERGVVVSRDIVSEGLGYNILAQFVMIPFCFCVQTRYVNTTHYSCGVMPLLSIVILYSTGYYIYRASNSEKNNFRMNPKDPKLTYLKTMPTSSGKHLLISGWWGLCRHPNYLGDLIISLSYALCTGFGHVIPYLGTVFLLLLLVHRERLDNEDCKKKYGEDWDKYCNIVKYRIVPGIY